jgi:hypothetical protein
MPGITIGFAHYDTIDEAMIDCDCGHRVLMNQVEEIWYGPKVTNICDDCFYGKGEASCLDPAQAR